MNGESPNYNQEILMDVLPQSGRICVIAFLTLIPEQSV